MPTARLPDGSAHAGDERHHRDPSHRRRGAADQGAVLTTYALDDLVYSALRNGAAGFLLETMPAERLVDGVEVAAAGETLLAPTLTGRPIERHLAELQLTSGAQAVVLAYESGLVVPGQQSQQCRKGALRQDSPIDIRHY